MDIIVFIAIFALVLVPAIVATRASERTGAWIDDSGTRMKRFVAGKWQYREMTENEAEDWRNKLAW